MSFASEVKKARRNCKDPERGGELTFERFAELIAVALPAGDGYPAANTVNNWERGTAQPPRHRRDVQLAIVAVLLTHGGLATHEAADALLRLGNYAPLTAEERDTLPPGQLPAPPLPAAEASPGSPLIGLGTNNTIGSMTTGNVASGDQVNISIHLPPPAATQTPTHQLRAPTRDFVGRKHEQAQLIAALQRADGAVGAISGLAGLAGMGGIGKSELAIVVANALRERFPDGQIVIPLFGSRQDGSMLSVAQALARAIQPFTGEARLPDDEAELENLYRSLLAGKRVLVVADDARDAAHVRRLLPPAGSALLITSRSRFDLPGMARVNLGALSEQEALQLLGELAPELDVAQASAVAVTCEGLPLALRLAGGALAGGTVSVESYLARLADERRRLRALRNPDEPEHPDQSIEASLSLSYALLPERARAQLRQLGVFVADFDPAAAGAALAQPPDEELEEGLGLLYRRSLLESDQHAAPRYDLHELVRVFALARLREAGEDDERAARLRHASHYIDVANRAARMFLDGGDSIFSGLALFDRERANLDDARRWLQANAGSDDVDALLVADADATVHIGDLRYAMRGERIPQLEAALNAATRSRHREAQGMLLGNLGLAYAALGDARKAIDFYQQRLMIAREIGDRRGEGTALGNLGYAYAELGEARRAIDFFQQHLAVAREIGDRRGEGNALGNLGMTYKNLGEARRAIDFFQQHLTIAREIGDRRGEGNALGNLGSAYAVLGEARPAIDFFQHTLDLMREIGDRRGEGNAIWGLGVIYDVMGDARKAIDFYQQHLAVAREIGDRRGEGAALGNLGSAYAVLGEARRAIDFYQQHLAIAREIGDRQGEARGSWNLGKILVDEGRVAEALPLLDACVAFEQEIGHPDAEPDAAKVAHVRQHRVWPSQTSPLPDDLPEPVRQALQAGDSAALQAALEALPEDERGATVAALRAAGIIGRGPDVAQLLREFESLLRDAALVAGGDDGPREGVLQALAQQEQNGWMLRGPVERIWSGERERDALVAGLDEQDTQLIERVLELVREYERGERRTPAQLLAALPEAVRAALDQQDEPALRDAIEALPDEQRAEVAALLAELQGAAEEASPAQDEPPGPDAQPDSREAVINALPEEVQRALRAGDVAALQAALAALPPEQARQIVEQLQATGIIGVEEEPARPRPDIDQVIQNFLPLLGDIALAAHGDAVARQLAEEALPGLEQNGWRLSDAAQRIWAGERDAAALTAGLDEQDSALVRRTLRMVEDGPNMIFVARSIALTQDRRNAERLAAQALASGDTGQRAELARQFAEAAARVEQLAAAPYQEFAAQLRALAARLSES